jgi:lipid-A-disaccharide synthase
VQPPRAPRILISAGEPSGDQHGAALARALRERWPEAQLFGFGGPLMAAEGVELLAGVDELAVVGIFEVVSRLPFFLRLLRRTRALVRSGAADLVIPIDYPGFNLRLSRSAREAGVPVLYYIAPQVWAWHRSRMRDLAANTSRIAVILPFEEALFRAAGANATFVGHPLLDSEPPTMPRDRFCAAHDLDPARPILALFPGSRKQELRRHLRPCVDAARLLQAELPELQPIIARGNGLGDEHYRGAGVVQTRDSWSALRHARAAIVKSGTSTLQAALAVTPHVVMYRLHPASFELARRLVRVPHVGLANLVAGERVSEELLQDDATAERLAAAVRPLLEETSPERQAAVAALRRVRAMLAGGLEDARPGTAQRVADLAAELLAGADAR